MQEFSSDSDARCVVRGLQERRVSLNKSVNNEKITCILLVASYLFKIMLHIVVIDALWCTLEKNEARLFDGNDVSI